MVDSLKTVRNSFSLLFSTYGLTAIQGCFLLLTKRSLAKDETHTGEYPAEVQSSLCSMHAVYKQTNNSSPTAENCENCMKSC